jgi:hypothetical protein
MGVWNQVHIQLAGVASGCGVVLLAGLASGQRRSSVEEHNQQQEAGGHIDCGGHDCRLKPANDPELLSEQLRQPSSDPLSLLRAQQILTDAGQAARIRMCRDSSVSDTEV